MTSLILGIGAVALGYYFISRKAPRVDPLAPLTPIPNGALETPAGRGIASAEQAAKRAAIIASRPRPSTGPSGPAIDLGQFSTFGRPTYSLM